VGRGGGGGEGERGREGVGAWWWLLSEISLLRFYGWLTGSQGMASAMKGIYEASTHQGNGVTLNACLIAGYISYIMHLVTIDVTLSRHYDAVDLLSGYILCSIGCYNCILSVILTSQAGRKPSCMFDCDKRKS